MPPVDTRQFQFGVISDIDYDETEERQALEELTQRARQIVQDQVWLPPCQDLLLAYGVFDIIGLYLARFEHPFTLNNGDRRDEIWLVLGDLPTIFFTTDASPTRAAAMRTYCDLAEAWANAVLSGGDVSDCYDMGVEPTPEHARMLQSRVASIRELFLPDLEGRVGPIILDS